MNSEIRKKIERLDKRAEKYFDKLLGNLICKKCGKRITSQNAYHKFFSDTYLHKVNGKLHEVDEEVRKKLEEAGKKLEEWYKKRFEKIVKSG